MKKLICIYLLVILTTTVSLTVGCGGIEVSSDHEGYEEEVIVLPSYRWGFNLSFGEGGNVIPYLGDGWSGPEDGFTWADGKSASLMMPVRRTPHDLLLNLEIKHVFLGDGLIDGQRVEVIVNDQKLDQWTLDSDYKPVQELIIPNYLKDRPYLEITFKLPDANSPAALGLFDDPRVLSIALKEILIEEFERYYWGTKIDFTENGDAEKYKNDGWSDPELEFTWTEGNSAALKLTVYKPNADLRLTANVQPFLFEEKVEVQNVNIFGNGELLGNWIINESGFQDQHIIIPAEVIKNGWLNITFELPDAASPQELGLSEDNRILGLQFRSIRITETNN